MKLLKTTTVENTENTLSLKIDGLVVNKHDAAKSLVYHSESPVFVIANSVNFQVRVECVDIASSNFTEEIWRDIALTIVSIRFFKIHEADDCEYEIKLDSSLDIKEKHFKNDEGTWRQIDRMETSMPSFDITAKLTTFYKKIYCFAPLHDDIELTDFLLKGEDGSVAVHKAVLAATSPVLRRMLGGTWRETTEGVIKVPGTSKDTLQHLKNYLYLQILPETGLQYLVLLATFYMIPSLEKRAIEKLLVSLTAKTACDLLDFAFMHKARGLEVAILRSIQKGAVRVDQMEEHLTSTVEKDNPNNE